MGFNYAKERRKFEAGWKKLRQEYRQAGMDAHAIEQIYLFDFGVFCSERSYSNHTQQMPDMYIAEDSSDHSSLLKKFESLSVTFDESDFFSEDAWLETIEDPSLFKRLKALERTDLELLKYLVLEGHTQQELAEKWHCSQRLVSKRLQKIKKLLK